MGDFQRAEGSLLGNSAITLHLRNLGYPEKSIQSMLRCGSETGQYIIRQCSCKAEPIPLKHHCNLRTCPECAKIRKRRIRNQYLPFLNHYKSDRTNFLSFLTISPENYENLDYGLDHVKKSFARFLRRKYVRERVKAGLYVIEVTNKGNGWNVHLHAILFGRYLDNRIRGLCLDCGQNLMKYDGISQKYYCARRVCNSTNVVVHDDSKLVKLFKESSGRNVNVQITRNKSCRFTMNYLLKYISADKEDFASPDLVAQYIVSTHKKRLISVIGSFSGNKKEDSSFLKDIKSKRQHCNYCGDAIYYIFDMEVSDILNKDPPPPDLTCWVS